LFEIISNIGFVRETSMSLKNVERRTRHGWNDLFVGASAIFLTAFSLATLAGCGGGGGGGGGGSTNSGGQSTSYADVIALQNGQTAVVNLTVQSSGSATGTAVISGLATQVRTPDVVSLTDGTYDVTGTVSNLNFQLSGSISASTFSLDGTLPSGNTDGQASLVINSTTITGVVTSSTNLNPPPPPF
jgi:hypothetical protein